MKWLCVKLGPMLLALSAASVAQTSQPVPAPAGTMTPAAPAPATTAPVPTAPAAAGPAGAVTSPTVSPAGVTAPTAGAPMGPAGVVATPAVDASRYTIGADDALQITVWKEPTLSGTFPVRPDGMISLVLVGDMPAAGLTPMQLGVNISERLKKYIQEPSVSVVVMAVNSQRIFVVGEVGHVGPIMMTPGMSPLQAVAASGGLTPFAHSTKIYILRGVQGKQTKIPFDYKKALKGDSKQLISLQPGDTIVVP